MHKFSDCDECYGYCCIASPTFYTILSDSDVGRIAAHFGIEKEDFRKWFTKKLPDPGWWGLKSSPNACYFHTNGKCGIYKIRPQICRETMPKSYGNVSCRDYEKQRAGI